MSVQAATTASVNVAYMSMAQQLDLCDIRDIAQSMGVHLAAPRATQQNGTPTTTTAPDVNISSVLGTNNIAPLTMASAYATIANDGSFCAPIAIDSITGPHGKQLGGQPRSCKQVIPVQVARAAAQALKPVLTQGTAAGATTADGDDEFGKTGTTDNAEQIWLIGSTSRVTTAVWMGNTDGKTLNLRYYAGPEGYTYAVSRAPLWKAAQTIINTHYPAGPLLPLTPSIDQSTARTTGPSIP
jgi:membrane peptidoglycan carboxypeptidase